MPWRGPSVGKSAELVYPRHIGVSTRVQCDGLSVVGTPRSAEVGGVREGGPGRVELGNEGLGAAHEGRLVGVHQGKELSQFVLPVRKASPSESTARPYSDGGTEGGSFRRGRWSRAAWRPWGRTC